MNRSRSHSNRWPGHLIRVATVLGLALLANGCAFLKPAENQSHYYLLTATEPAMATAPARTAAQDCVVRVVPVGLADYLNTKGMAVRKGTNEVSFALFHRWAEPLDSGIRRVLVENLRATPGISEVLTDQTVPLHESVYAISVHVLACEGVIADHRGTAAFEAAWDITGPGPQRKVLDHGVYRAKPTSWKPGDYGQLASRVSEALGDFSKVLANALAQARGTELR